MGYFSFPQNRCKIIKNILISKVSIPNKHKKERIITEVIVQRGRQVKKHTAIPNYFCKEKEKLSLITYDAWDSNIKIRDYVEYKDLFLVENQYGEKFDIHKKDVEINFDLIDNLDFLNS